MAIYEKSVRALMKESMAPAVTANPNGVFSKQQALDWFARHYPKIKPATVSAHLTRLSTNATSRVHFSAKPGEDDVLYQIDGSHYRLYRAGQDPAPITDATTPREAGPKDFEGAEEEPDSSGAAPGSAEFAYEHDLRNYLAKNLSLLEPGLRLYEEEGIRGIEFPVGGRFIDILAVDKSGALVVIELKVSRGYDRVIGQLMRYMAWIKENLADPGQSVRGVIVGREITKDLLLACSLVQDVRLFEYELSLTLRQV
jgi:endonuclease